MVNEVSDVLGALWLGRRAGLAGPDQPPLRITLSLATSLQRPVTPVQKATLDLIRSLAPRVVAQAG